ncbi:hypothetical protein RI065_02395 [Mycoplasmatota bacterium zrk1]
MKSIQKSFLFVFVVAVAIVFYLYSSAFWFGPKDLGVKYTEDDLSRISLAIGGDRIYPDDMSEDDDIFEDYYLNYSDPKAYNLEITGPELGAIIEEILPPAFPIKDLQMKINDDDSVEVSCRANIGVLVEHFFSDVADDIPIKLPEKANIYLKGKLETTNGVSEVNIDEAKIGSISIPSKYLTPEKQVSIARYADRFQTAAPGVVIRKLSFDNNKIIFDGDFPDSYYITSKG